MTSKTWTHQQFSGNTQKKTLFFKALMPHRFACETVQRATGYPHGDGYRTSLAYQEV